jgi:hypothetical protein
MIESAYPFFMKKLSDVKMLSAVLLTALLFSFSAHAQTFERKIDWQTTPKSFSTIDGKTIIQPTFTKAAHSDQFDLLPIYAEIIPIQISGEVSVQILNPVYSTSDHLDSASLPFIKETIEPKAELSLLRKQPNASISFLPFRKNANGVIEKLESFNLRLSVVPVLQKRSTNAYATTSALSYGNFYKIATTADGMYKIDYSFIKNKLNVDPNSFNLNTLAIFGNGGGMVPD